MTKRKDINDVVAGGGELKLFRQSRAGTWTDDILKSRTGETRGCGANVTTILVNSPDWKGCLRFNEWRQDVELWTRPPWYQDDEPAGFADTTWTPKVMDDRDITRIQSYMDRAFHIGIGIDQTCRAIDIAASRSAYHPVREYLARLEWDGTPRIDEWLVRYCGAVVDGSERATVEQATGEKAKLGELLYEDYAACAGRWWMISAVARIMDPGCKVDHVLVLEGKQHLMKSSALLALCHDPAWCSDTPIPIGHKDAYAVLEGTWIYELAEIDGIVGRKEITAMKAYLSSAADKYRPAFARRTILRGRQVVFAGTANRNDYLRDPTGNRRYWPIKCTLIDLLGLAEVRDQLWAEAVQLFADGMAWYPKTDDEHRMCSEQQDMRCDIDVWSIQIGKWARGKEKLQATGATDEHVTVLGALTEALGIRESDRQTKAVQMRVAQVLHALGYIRAPLRVSCRFTMNGGPVKRRARPYFRSQ